MRTRYSIINMLFNIGGQFLTMLLSFINRMVFIRCLSAEYLGSTACLPMCSAS